MSPIQVKHRNIALLLFTKVPKIYAVDQTAQTLLVRQQVRSPAHPFKAAVARTVQINLIMKVGKSRVSYQRSFLPSSPVLTFPNILFLLSRIARHI